MNLSVRMEAHSLQDLKERLTGGTRGSLTAFKLALGEAVHYWRIHYLPRHFENGARQRYGSQGFMSARYAEIRPHGQYVVGSKGRRSVDEMISILGRDRYSYKEARQVRAGFKPDNRPMVFSGLSREGFLHGAFRVRGTAKAVRGTWNDHRINWQAFSARNRELANNILVITPQEINALSHLIEQNFFPYYLRLVQDGQRLPKLEQLPIIAA